MSTRLHSSCPPGEEGEPELRKQLRAARLADQHAKMRAALAEKLAADEEEARRREEQVSFKGQFADQINAWKNKHKVGSSLSVFRAVRFTFNSALKGEHPWSARFSPDGAVGGQRVGPRRHGRPAREQSGKSLMHAGQ